jgi:sulfonate transport system permease protein
MATLEPALRVGVRAEEAGVRRRAAWPSAPVLVLRRLLVPLALLLLWQLVVETGVYNRAQLPLPLDVIAAARELAAIDQLGPNILASVQRVVLGFALGSAIALALGLAIGLSRSVEEMVAPTLQAIRAVPSLAWVPLFLLWLGIGERSKIALIALGVFFPVLTNLVAGVRQIDRKLVEVGRAYGLRGLALTREVMLPAALPSLMTGLRLGLAQGWLFLVAAELLGASKGLGFLLVDGSNSSRTDIIVLGIVLLAVLGKSSDWLLQTAERRLLRWADTYKGGA